LTRTSLLSILLICLPPRRTPPVSRAGGTPRGTGRLRALRRPMTLWRSTSRPPSRRCSSASDRRPPRRP